MPEIGTSDSMSEDGKRSVAEWPQLRAHPRRYHCGTPRAANDWDSRNNGELPHILLRPNLDSLKNFRECLKQTGVNSFG
jgi:hypothetical protein